MGSVIRLKVVHDVFDVEVNGRLRNRQFDLQLVYYGGHGELSVAPQVRAESDPPVPDVTTLRQRDNPGRFPQVAQNGARALPIRRVWARSSVDFARPLPCAGRVRSSLVVSISAHNARLLFVIGAAAKSLHFV